MTGKELLLRTLRHERLPTVPWVPFAGVHAGKLKGYNAIEVLTDGDKLFESLMAVNQTYAPDGQPIVFDLQIEAEILGCELHWATNAPPSVVSYPLATDLTVPDRLPSPDDGRLPIVLDVMRRMNKAVGEHTALYGLICGPFTLASHLRGTEIFMDMFYNETFLHDLLAYTARVNKRMADLYLQAGMDVIAVVDPLVSQISSRHLEAFLLTPFSEIFAHIRAQGALSAFFVCGDATRNIEVMCHTGPDAISVDENIDLPTAKLITDQHNIAICGNIPLTTRMLLGTQLDNMQYVLDLLDTLDHHNLVISPGCDMPYDVPPENVVGIMQAIREPETARKMLENYQGAALDIEVELPDYASLDKPLMEVFTLDSSTCPACGYMLNAALRATRELAGQVDMVEYKITERENVARANKMGIRNLPCILINGNLEFSSIIPSNEELIGRIKQYIN